MDRWDEGTGVTEFLHRDALNAVRATFGPLT
jgi:hypothetical protein